MRCMRQVGNNEWREESYVYGQYMYRRGKKIRKEKKITKKLEECQGARVQCRSFVTLPQWPRNATRQLRLCNLFFTSNCHSTHDSTPPPPNSNINQQK